MKVDSSIRSHAWKCLVLLAGMAFATEAKSISLFRFSRTQGGVAFTLGVDEGSLRESIMVQGSDTNDAAVVEARVNEALGGIDERISNVLRRRMDGLGLDGVRVIAMRGHRFHILVPRMDRATRAKAVQSLQSVGYLEFRLTHPRNDKLVQDLMDSGKVPEGYAVSARGNGFVRVDNYHAIASRAGYKVRLAAFGKPPQGYQFMLEKSWDGTYHPNYVSRKSELTGEYIVSADAERDEVGRPVVSFRLNGEGGRLMRKLTRNYIAHGEKNNTDRGRQLAIVLDGELISAPVLQSEISTRGQISGSFDVAEAQRLANYLNAGALPVPLMILAEDTWAEY